MRRIIVIRCLWGLTVLALVATLVLAGAAIGTTIAASIAAPADPSPALGFAGQARQPALVPLGLSLR